MVDLHRQPAAAARPLGAWLHVRVEIDNSMPSAAAAPWMKTANSCGEVRVSDSAGCFTACFCTPLALISFSHCPACRIWTVLQRVSLALFNRMHSRDSQLVLPTSDGCPRAYRGRSNDRLPASWGICDEGGEGACHSVVLFARANAVVLACAGLSVSQRAVFEAHT